MDVAANGELALGLHRNVDESGQLHKVLVDLVEDLVGVLAVQRLLLPVVLDEILDELERDLVVLVKLRAGVVVLGDALAQRVDEARFKVRLLFLVDGNRLLERLALHNLLAFSLFGLGVLVVWANACHLFLNAARKKKKDWHFLL